MAQIFEYRGVEGLVYAPVNVDDNGNYTTGTVKPLAGVAEISKATDSTNEPHYYDNIPAVVVSSTGSDEITINTSAIPLDVLADITGQVYDAATGMFIEQERTPTYYALGYQTKTTSGDIMFVWRLKGTFNIPDQTNVTEDDSTDANGQELTYTGISTTHKFTKTNKPAKAITVNTAVNPLTANTFFGTVQTPDSVQPAVVVPEVVLDRSNVEVDVNGTVTLTATTKPTGETVTWSSGNSTYATVADGVVTGKAAGSTTITASITVDGTAYTDTCAVTVNTPSA